MTPQKTVEIPRWLRAYVRAREISLTILAAMIGAIAGLVVVVMSIAVSFLHVLFFNMAPGDRLSAADALDPVRALFIPLAGGLLFGAVALLLRRWRPDREVDPIEANALHGGRMSFRGSTIVAFQTVWSSGVGASVGLEAGYTQWASGIASWWGRQFRLRRNDQQVLVGCGAAAFGAPLAGAFYAFELIIGSYTAASLAPVGVAAVSGYLIAQAIDPKLFSIVTDTIGHVTGRDLAIASVLGVCASFLGIVLSVASSCARPF